MLLSADVVVGLAWGDEAKGKITSALAATGQYDAVARWAGGNNAGHTVYVNGEKYKTHLVPSGVFHGMLSIVGPGCVLHPEEFEKELAYLAGHGFDTSLVKVSPNCHIVQDEHIEFDKQNLAKKLGTTSKGIAPSYAAKAARTGLLAKDYYEGSDILWDGQLSGVLLCEGAQGAWLDIDHGNYPYVTSSITLAYGACSIGFAPQLIKSIWGAAKIYDTRSGEDPIFPASLLDDPMLSKVGEIGAEYGVTTGRRRKVNWLDVDMLIKSINLTGCTHVVVSKCDVLEEAGVYRMYCRGIQNELSEFESITDMTGVLETLLRKNCSLLKRVIFSSSPENI
jgi:adenylosuccinate synthase